LPPIYPDMTTRALGTVVGVEGGTIKNASCRERGDRTVGELGAAICAGGPRTYCCGAMAPR